MSGNTRTETAVVFVVIKHNGLIAYGEACLPPYLGETVEQTIAFFEKCKPKLAELNTSDRLDLFLSDIDLIDPGCNAAKAAIDIALHDLFAKSQNLSFCAFKNIPFLASKQTSFTIGIDHEAIIIQKIKEAENFSVLKIKAGTNNDKALIQLIRQHSQKPLFVDVNQGWTNPEEALRMIEWMSSMGVVLIEQPLKKDMIKDMKWLNQRSPLPIFADESVKRLTDLQKLEGAFSGINIKLMKCTGLNEALKMIDFCQQNKIKIFLGCMAESSCATAAMSQLMHFADYVDLDAPQLYLNDPFIGPKYLNGNILVEERPGIGAFPEYSQRFNDLQ